MFTTIIDTYQDYKAESKLMGYQPNNVFHFLYLYLCTTTYSK